MSARGPDQDQDPLVGELGRLGARTPEPPRTLADRIMRQVALRPRPRARSWWTALTARRAVTLRFRWSQLCVAATMAALACGVGLRARRPTLAEDAPRAVEAQPVLIRFALPAAGARAVSVAGDFNGWRADSMPLVRGPGGLWTATVALPPGTWSYSFTVDGKWVEDPFAESYRADGFGGRNALVHVGG